MKSQPEMRYEINVNGLSRNVRIQALESGSYRVWLDDEKPMTPVTEREEDEDGNSADRL